MSEDPLFTTDEMEAARIAFARPVTFVKGCSKIEHLPDTHLPEVAFAGRSNVGKSSLINALTEQHQLARASSEPGRTREINFFLVDERIHLADLPGYGFAKASKTETKAFQNLGRSYLRGRPNLMRVFLLIDARHGLKNTDTEALDALDTSAVSYQIVLTKADKIKVAELEAVKADTLKKIARRPAAFPRVVATSSDKGLGIEDLRAEILFACNALTHGQD